MVKVSEADLIKYESGKKDLPLGISRTKYGYRLQRKVNNVPYDFGSVRNLKLALRLNNGIEKMTKDFREVVENPKVASLNQLESILLEHSITDVSELTRQLDVLKDVVLDQNDLIIRQHSLAREQILNLSNERMTFWQRLTGKRL